MNVDRLKPSLDTLNDMKDCKQVHIITKMHVTEVHDMIRAKDVGERKDAFPRLLYILPNSSPSITQ